MLISTTGSLPINLPPLQIPLSDNSPLRLCIFLAAFREKHNYPLPVKQYEILKCLLFGGDKVGREWGGKYFISIPLQNLMIPLTIKEGIQSQSFANTEQQTGDF